MASSSHSSAHTVLTASPTSSTLSLSANSSIPSITLRPTPSLSHPNKTPSSISLFSDKWSTKVSFFPTFFTKIRDSKTIKEELLQAIEPLDRGADASPEDQQRIDEITRKLEAVNPTKEPLKSDFLNFKWELICTISSSIMQTQTQNFKIKDELPSNQCGYTKSSKYGILAILQPGYQEVTKGTCSS
ncbi:uncharacterized protein LOC130779714 isoform X2 [Actinidia eriantha]|uniref:uncharacterized protein LOC130779714 isoform X2 n=1 Tax=Actinidia eriantha TaxID=165200 RepID=UPI0025853069|nr:uncharacterized protein LOC130779714 isoform X2 [Actinidia eriantha]